MEAFEAVLTPEQMRAWEQSAFGSGVDPLLLMEDAARAVYARLRPLLGERHCRKVLVLCGAGNNGGDGAALARLLLRDGFETLLMGVKEPATDSAKTMRAYYEALGGQAFTWLPEDDAAAWENRVREFGPDCVVDALFGTGYRGTPTALYQRVIGLINRLDARVVLSVDVPSGMNSLDGSVAYVGDAPACIRATHTVTLGSWKSGLFLTPAPECAGEVSLAPIALPLTAPETGMKLITPGALSWIGKRPLNAHKGSAGRVLLYMGSLGMAGAAAMAAKAALRAGAGLVTVACPREIIPVLQSLVPNAMCVPAETLEDRIPAHDVLAAGCGLGTEPDTLKRLTFLLEREKGVTVLDADALNLLAEAGFPLPERTVLTPHPGEAARLLHTAIEQILKDPADAVRKLARQYGAVALLKGRVSLISDGEQVIFQRHGAPALAKGGSGDALTGILAALCADPWVCPERPEPERLLCRTALASLLLGLAGEEAQARYGDRSALTGEVIDLLEVVLRRQAV